MIRDYSSRTSWNHTVTKTSCVQGMSHPVNPLDDGNHPLMIYIISFNRSRLLNPRVNSTICRLFSCFKNIQINEKHFNLLEWQDMKDSVMHTVCEWSFLKKMHKRQLHRKKYLDISNTFLNGFPPQHWNSICEEKN